MSYRRILKSCLSLSTAQKQAYSTSGNTRLTRSEVKKKQNELFGKEKARQLALVSRIEKIQVDYKGIPEECTLLMNKGLSTPFNCAMHINELTMKRSGLALVNGQPWDIHRPLVEDCQLEFLHFRDEDPSLLNHVFWRSGSFILGYILERAFKDEYNIQLCSFPKPNVRSGSFVYDADLDLPDWKPSISELNCLSRIGGQLQQEDCKFERLEVDASVALKIFEHNKFKTEQIPFIAAKSSSGSTVTLYRMKDHIDISNGPMMSSTDLLLRFNVTAVHDIESEDFGKLKRVQGVATPKQLPIHFWAFDRLRERASQLNKAVIPSLSMNKDSITVDANGS